MARIKLTETVLRDGHQSLIAADEDGRNAAHYRAYGQGWVSFIGDGEALHLTHV